MRPSLQTKEGTIRLDPTRQMALFVDDAGSATLGWSIKKSRTVRLLGDGEQLKRGDSRLTGRRWKLSHFSLTVLVKSS